MPFPLFEESDSPDHDQELNITEVLNVSYDGIVILLVYCCIGHSGWYTVRHTNLKR